MNEELKRILEETGWRKRWLASLLGIHPSLISKWLSGERNPEKYMGKIHKILQLYKQEKIRDTRVRMREKTKPIAVSESSHAVAKEYCKKRQKILGAWASEVIKKAANGELIDVSKIGNKSGFQVVD